MVELLKRKARPLLVLVLLLCADFFLFYKKGLTVLLRCYKRILFLSVLLKGSKLITVTEAIQIKKIGSYLSPFCCL